MPVQLGKTALWAAVLVQCLAYTWSLLSEEQSWKPRSGQNLCGARVRRDRAGQELLTSESYRHTCTLMARWRREPMG